MSSFATTGVLVPEWPLAPKAPPLSDEQRRRTDELVAEATEVVVESVRASVRLQRAREVYRERLEGTHREFAQ